MIATELWCTWKELVLCKTYTVIGKNVLSKSVYYKQTMECLHLIFWPETEKRVCYHVAKLEPNRDGYSRPGPLISTVEPCFYIPVIYIFPSFATFLSGPFSFPTFIMYCLPRFYVLKISNFAWFTSLDHLQREQFWHKRASTERMLVYTFFFS
jgi:hypothetical protein